MSKAFQDNFYIEGGIPQDGKYFHKDNRPWVDVNEVNNTIEISYRHIGLFVNINKKLYWYEDNVTNAGLVPFTIGGVGVQIDDTVTAPDKTWSSFKIDSELDSIVDIIDTVESTLQNNIDQKGNTTTFEEHFECDGTAKIYTVPNSLNNKRIHASITDAQDEWDLFPPVKKGKSLIYIDLSSGIYDVTAGKIYWVTISGIKLPPVLGGSNIIGQMVIGTNTIGG